MTGAEPLRVEAAVERDKDFGTDIYSSVRADFGSFELSFYISTQMAARQVMVFHGDKGFIEVKSPFNADRVRGGGSGTDQPEPQPVAALPLPDSRQYRREAEAFAKAALSGDHGDIVSLESSKNNQKVIDAIYRAGETGGWENV